MKKIIIIWLVLLFTCPVFAKENEPVIAKKDCYICTKGEPCPYLSPSVDGCNTCQGVAWCAIDNAGIEHWYTDGTSSCTLASCYWKEGYEIKKPFKN